jgi:hypothetical protein
MKDVSEQINDIRRKNGNELTQCPTCCRAPHSPFRVHGEHGKIVNGCIDPIHTAHLTPLSESMHWHMTAGAKRWRSSMLVNLKRK